MLKIEELKRLVSKYSQYCTNPDGIIKLAIHCSINGDNKLLDGKLAPDCPLCTGARGINKKEEFIEHLDSHQEMAMNRDMMFRKFKEYVLAHENFTE